MSFEQLYRILRARRRLALSLYAAIIAVAVIVTLLLPKMYTAKTQVMVDLKPDPISGLTQLATMQPSGYLSTQVNLVKSDAVARRVAKDLHLADNPQMRAKWAKETHERGNFEDWMGKTLLKGLTVSVVRDSSIIEIEYESISPSFAAALANAFANAYIATVVDM
ncbi:MAG: chain length determinant protein EpsF, partial [Burkholderiales bacterium]|nr:chain length determinant protein EpsF [Burkholderiales bacterium]